MLRPGFKFWYRNPDRPSQDSLGIAMGRRRHEDHAPDFMFFVELPNGRDCSGYHRSTWDPVCDSLPKLRGLARYAETHASRFSRIEAVAELDGKLRILDDPGGRPSSY